MSGKPRIDLDSKFKVAQKSSKRLRSAPTDSQGGTLKARGIPLTARGITDNFDEPRCYLDEAATKQVEEYENNCLRDCRAKGTHLETVQVFHSHFQIRDECAEALEEDRSQPKLTRMYVLMGWQDHFVCINSVDKFGWGPIPKC